MKNKIAIKLALYFSIILLVFSIMIGIVFMLLFRNHTVEIYKADLQKRAVTIAAALSGNYTQTGNGAGKGRQGNYGGYLKVLDEMAMTDVWIVDENLELITNSRLANRNYIYADLPADADKVVQEVFTGKTGFSEGFSGLLNTPTLTVGTPIYSGGTIIGALLLHSPVEGITRANTQGFWILAVSVLAAMALAVLLSVFLSFSFTQPLKKMQSSAMKLAGGDYTAKTGVAQRDEIGELAGAIDVLSEKLDLASRESERLLQLRQDFVANISHELRTPVTVIRGSLEALCDGVVHEPEQVKKYHAQMLGESIFLQRLVDDLLDLSRLQNPDFKIEMSEVNLCEVLDDAARTAGQMAKQKNIAVKREQDTQLLTVPGDYGRLRQMFLIVLDNAVKFSPPGSEISLTHKGKTVSVKDNGPGIPKEDLPYIFDRFYKTKSAENENGTGLGLSIAKQIADRHGVKVSLTSEPGEGAVFIFEF